jgi:hypothetical protein
LVNETTRTGLRRAIAATWDKLPEALTATVVALVVFGFGVWIDVRDIKSDMDGIKTAQLPPRLCERIGDCATIAKLGDAMDICHRNVERCESHIVSHDREAEQWKQRIIRLEQQFYEINTQPKARADPFTGTEGRELERRLHELETKAK